MSYTLILPLISTGNVPQLTTDLILENNSNLQRIENYFNTDLQVLLHSFAGFDNNKILSGIEVYEDDVNKIVVIQQRSPIITPFELKFYKTLFNQLMFSENKKFYNKINKVIILDSVSGSDPYIDMIKSEKYDNLYQLPNFLKVAVSNLNPDINKEYFTKMNESLTQYYNELKENIKNPQVQYTDAYFHSNEILPKLNDTILTFEGDSFQKRIIVESNVLKIVSSLVNDNTSSKIDISYLNMLVYEGDNSLDARDYLFILAKKLLPKIIDLQKQQLKTPASWVNIYGSKHLTKELRESIYS